MSTPDQSNAFGSRVICPPCPKCEMPMRLGFAGPLEEPGYERRIYECLTCKESKTVVIRLDPPRK